MPNSKQTELNKQNKEKDAKTTSLDDENVDDETNHLSSAEGSDKGSDHEDEKTKELKEEESIEEDSSENKAERKGNSKKGAKDKKTVGIDSESSILVEASSLPNGWSRKVVQRRTGKTAGRYDVYIFNPNGKRFRSRTELSTYLKRSKSNLKAEEFDFNPQKKSDNDNRTPSKRAMKSTKRPQKRKALTSPVSSSKRKKSNTNEAKSAAEKKKLLVKLPLVSPKKIYADYARQTKSKSKVRNQSKNSRSPAKGSAVNARKKSGKIKK
ncbi:methyl-CpG-binding protein 2-like [Centruroides sculpturatus]|uniref:methyl-CpG-binding protein 2-like n=1 Tax=Centruroides sculpturatus TaxID=218467 RepID=UPI000C6D801C|nr:methyl-CpG-binding protein 2-like [Centruroides sculpturatus]